MYINGTFTSPTFQTEKLARPLEGQPATAWYETYVQLRANYVKLPFGSESDRHPRHYLVEESEAVPVGWPNSPLVQFTRVFSQIPAPHAEYRLVSYTFPGLSGLLWKNGKQVWDKYARAVPATLFRNATVTYTYQLGPSSLSLPTQILYNDTPVDFCGTVYVEDETGVSVVEGVTSPLIRPGQYLVSDQAQRWWGPIFCRETVRVSLGSATAST